VKIKLAPRFSPYKTSRTPVISANLRSATHCRRQLSTCGSLNNLQNFGLFVNVEIAPPKAKIPNFQYFWVAAANHATRKRSSTGEFLVWLCVLALSDNFACKILLMILNFDVSSKSLYVN